MKLTINETRVDMIAKEITSVFTFVSSLDEIASKDGYRNDKILDQVTSKVSSAIASQVIEKYEEEIIKRVDIEAIVKKIQIMVVQSVTPGGHR